MQAAKYLFSVALISLAAPAVAQTDETVAKAKELFRRGAQRFDAGDYGGAIADFQGADQLIPKPAFSFNLGKAYDKLHEPGRAIFYYRQYLERDLHAPDRSQVQSDLSRLRTELRRMGKALLVVASQPSGAAVTTEGAFVGATPLPLTVSDGEHLLHLELGGIAKDVRASVKPGDVSDVRVSMNAPPPPTAYEPPPPAPAPAPVASSEPTSTRSEVKQNEDWSAPAPAPAPESRATEVPTAQAAPPPPPPPLAVVDPPPPSDNTIHVTGPAPAETLTQRPAPRSNALSILKYTALGLTVASAGAWTFFGLNNVAAANALQNNRASMTQQQAIDTANWGNQAGMAANYGCMPATIGFALATTALFIIDGVRR